MVASCTSSNSSRRNRAMLRSLCLRLRQAPSLASLARTTRIRLSLEALRNPRSSTETLRLGAYCMLLGEEDSAERYFDFALMLDDSLEIRKQIRDLRGQ